MFIRAQTCKITARKITTLATGLSGFYLNASTRRSQGGMSSTFQIERNRGSKEARQQLAALRDKWPIAFPADAKDVRPLAISAAGEIAAAMNWSLPYTLGVLARWKMASVYCKSVLAHEHRIGLDGSTAEPIDTKARTWLPNSLSGWRRVRP
jgi:hypothetical protein